MRLALCLSLCAASTPASAATFTIGLYVVNDHARAEQRGGETEANTAAIVADAASILQSAGLTSDVRIAFVGQRTYRALDPWPAPGSQAGIDVLTAFNGWVQSQADLDSKDLVFLFGSTGAEQSSTHAAFVNGLCGSNSTGFLRTTSDDGALLAALLAHAIGHSLGMKHDGQGNACATSGNLMAAAFDPADLPATFSTCSDADAETFLGGGPACLGDVPTQVYGNHCGDGLRSGAEACDCGAADCTAIDPCCNGATCQLAGGAACSSVEPCCTSACQIAGAAVVCRAGDACAVETKCDGAAPACPAAVLTASGTPCTVDDAAGACHLGTCFGAVASCTGATDGAVCGKGKQCASGACVASATIGPEFCPGDPMKTNGGFCGCGVPDLDADGDETPNCVDACPADPMHSAAPCDECVDDPEKTAPGQCGCGVVDDDTDEDGVADCVDGCPSDASVVEGECPKPRRRGCDASGGQPAWITALLCLSVRLWLRRRPCASSSF